MQEERWLIGAYFMWEDRLEASAEVAEMISIFMDLHPLAIVFDLCIHAIGALLHGILNGLAGFSLRKVGRDKFQTHSDYTLKDEVPFS